MKFIFYLNCICKIDVYLLYYVDSSKCCFYSGYFKPSVRYGVFPKVTAAAFIGYLLGKFSYQSTCAQKLLQLPDSKLADAIRRSKGITVSPRDTSVCMLTCSPWYMYRYVNKIVRNLRIQNELSVHIVSKVGWWIHSYSTIISVCHSVCLNHFPLLILLTENVFSI